MKYSLHIIAIFICAFCFSFELQATHNRAGEIIVEQLAPCEQYKVQATIITYTKASSTSADRDSLVICWGDGDQF